jgi:hypothetical protein
MQRGEENADRNKKNQKTLFLFWYFHLLRDISPAWNPVHIAQQ